MRLGGFLRLLRFGSRPCLLGRRSDDCFVFGRNLALDIYIAQRLAYISARPSLQAWYSRQSTLPTCAMSSAS